MPFSMSGNSNWSYNRFDAYEAQYKKTEEPKAEAEAVEEETLEEGSCGSKGYQEGGEVKCDKCEGKGCDHCDEKGTHKKSEKKGAKPDYLDFDKDGNKDEPMKDALKSKKEVKEETVEEGYQRTPEKGEAEDKKYAPVRGEKTPMPPRGNKRREDFEKWYAKNVKEGVDLSVFGDDEIEALAEALLGKS